MMFVWFLFSDEKDFQDVMDNELKFAERCLRFNPKSYSSWHHRCFIMENVPTPDWKQELNLCNKYLEYDERNCECLKRSEPIGVKTCSCVLPTVPSFHLQFTVGTTADTSSHIPKFLLKKSSNSRRKKSAAISQTSPRGITAVNFCLCFILTRLILSGYRKRSYWKVSSENLRDEACYENQS